MDDYFDLAGFTSRAAQDHPGCTVYALADHGGMPGLHKELARAPVSWRNLFEGSREANAIAVAPLLFSLTDAHERRVPGLANWVAQHGTFTSSLLLVVSPLPIDELAARLARRLDAALPENMNVLLRFFDPRVFEALVQALEPAQLQAFLGVADSWWYFDRRGALVPQASRHVAQDAYAAPLLLTTAQEAALLAASEPDQVAEQLATFVPEPWRGIPLPRRYDFLLRHMAAAREIGLSSTRDFMLYCAVALLEGEEFAVSPKWSELLGRVRRGELALGEAVGQ